MVGQTGRVVVLHPLPHVASPEMFAVIPCYASFEAARAASYLYFYHEFTSRACFSARSRSGNDPSRDVLLRAGNKGGCPSGLVHGGDLELEIDEARAVSAVAELSGAAGKPSAKSDAEPESCVSMYTLATR